MECYCPHYGQFYSQGDTSNDTVICPVEGLDSWGSMYWVYFALMCSAFLLLGIWCILQLLHLHNMRESGLRRDIVLICLLSVVLRLAYFILELVMLRGHTPTGQKRSVLAICFGTLYSAFWAISACAFLCLCQHWRHLDVESSRLLLELRLVSDAVVPDSQPPWQRQRLLRYCLLLALLHTADCIAYILNVSPRWHSVYFFWLCFVDLVVGFIGLSIAIRLHRNLRIWAGPSLQLFRKVLLSALTVSLLSIAFLGMGILFGLYARWYAMPSFIYMCCSHGAELLYTGVILNSVSSKKVRCLRRDSLGQQSSLAGSLDNTPGSLDNTPAATLRWNSTPGGAAVSASCIESLNFSIESPSSRSGALADRQWSDRLKTPTNSMTTKEDPEESAAG